MRFSRPLAIVALATLAASLLSSCSPSPAPSQPAGTLEKIKASGTILLGYRESSVPFSYLDDEGRVVGYSQDLAKNVVEAIRTELKLPKLDVKMVPITPRNRFDLVRNGAVDLECGSTGNTLERQKLVGYSNNIFIVRMQLLTRKDYGIKDFGDLNGKTVVTTAGTTNEKLVQVMNDENKMGMTVLIAGDHREAFLTLESKKAHAFLMDDVLLYGERTRAVRWGDWVITGSPQKREAYACIMRRDDPQFKKIVDDAIAKAMQSGEVETLYKKWFQSPIPPLGINLNFPMSEDMARLLKSPNDRPFE